MYMHVSAFVLRVVLFADVCGRFMVIPWSYSMHGCDDMIAAVSYVLELRDRRAMYSSSPCTMLKCAKSVLF